MTTDTDTNVRFFLSIWPPSRARVDTVHPTEADARRHLASEAARHGLAADLAELLKDEVSHRGLTLGGHPAHPRDDPLAPIRWQVVRATPATDPVPGDEHVVDAVLQFRGILLADPGSVAVTDAELAVTLGPQWRAVRGMVRRAAVATPEEASRLREAWDSALDGGAGLAALAAATAAVDAAHRASHRAAIGAGAWTALMRADAVARGIDADRVGTATLLAASCAEGATMVEDLVGQHGLTTAHVELARAPWCAAFGDIG